MIDREAKRARLTCWGDKQLVRWRSAPPSRGPRWRWWRVESLQVRRERGRSGIGGELLRQNRDVYWLTIWLTPWHALVLELVNWA